IQQSAAQESGAGVGTWAILVDAGTGPSVFSSDTIACNSCTGIEFRSPNHVVASSIIANNTIGVKFNGGGAKIDATMVSNTTWFDCTSENGNVSISIYAVDGTGTVKGTSCWTGGEYLQLGGFGGTSSPQRIQWPG